MLLILMNIFPKNRILYKYLQKISIIYNYQTCRVVYFIYDLCTSKKNHFAKNIQLDTLCLRIIDVLGNKKRYDDDVI